MPSCAVKWCKNHTRLIPLNSGISFHRFPKNHERTQAWLSVIGMSSETFLKKKRRLICSKHFLREDFRFGVSRPLMKISAVPSRELCIERSQDEIDEWNRTFLPPDKINDEKIDEEDDDVFSESEDVQPKRLKTDDDHQITYFDSSNDMEFVSHNLTETTDAENGNIDDIDAFMTSMAQRIKQLPESLKDVAKMNILAYVTELELQHNGE